MVTEQTVKILFPCIHGLAVDQMVTVNCFASRELKGTIKVVTGIDEEIAGRVIGASRYGETDFRAGLGVIALFSTPFFSGESYGLALAIGDKLARFGTCREWSEIYATGALPADGCGRIKAINGFPEKLEMLKQRALPDSLFLYPKDNLGTGANRVEEQLHILQKQGIKCIAVSRMSELEGRVWPAGEQPSPPLLDKITGRKTLPHVPHSFLITLIIAVLASLSLLLLFKPMEEMAYIPEQALNTPVIAPSSSISQDTSQKENSHQEDKEESVAAIETPTSQTIPVESAVEEKVIKSVDIDPSIY